MAVCEILLNTILGGIWGLVSVVTRLPGRSKALDLIASTTKNKTPKCITLLLFPFIPLDAVKITRSLLKPSGHLGNVNLGVNNAFQNDAPN